MSKRKPRADLRLPILIGVSVLALAALLYSVHGLRQRTPLQEGQPSPQTYIAPANIEVVDLVATEREKLAAQAQIPTVFTPDSRLRSLVTGAVLAAGLPGEVQDLLLNTYRRPDGVSEAEIPALVEEATLLAPEERRREVRLVLGRVLLPTAVPDARVTEAARAAAAQAVQPALQSLRAGQTIVARGESLTRDHLRVLERVGLYSARSAALKQTLAIAVGCLALGALFAAPLLYARLRLRRRISFVQLAFLTTLTLVALAAQRVANAADTNFLIVALVPLLVAVLVSEAAALLWTVWLALVLALLTPSGPLFTLIGVATAGAVASLLALRVRSRMALLLAGGASGLAAALALGAAALAVGGYTPLAVLEASGLLLAGGLLAGVLAVGLLPVAESGFDFLTDFRLVELSSPTSPLLQKLLLDAPGTYQHSLIISNLVEQAVTNIGGNPLLARVGALYHDVGKLRRPQFYAENQFSGENPHDALSPHLSYLIITAHVRDGVELLREHGLPRALEPFVVEHHGTTVLAYFYKRALEDSAKLDELNFRYPGPKPRTKETAVLMLADAVESASRTLTEPSQSSIRALIDRLIEQRQQDGQLSESPLNFHDLEVIANTFERMLTAILHRRIRYPSPEEIRGLRRDRDPRRNPTPAPG